MKASISAAIENIANFGDTDVFPFPFENRVFTEMPGLVQTALENINNDFEGHLQRHHPDNINTLAPAGHTAFRWATQLDPLWNAYFLALVIELGSDIEKARIPVNEGAVFSYRFVSPQSKGRIFDDSVNWQTYLQATIDATEHYPYIIICDISDFYSRVYHHRIENALKRLQGSSEAAHRIVRLLQVFSGGVSYGLPVGGPASRLLAEISLNSVDKLLRAESISFCRFVDDYRLFCTSREQAYQYLIVLSKMLFNEGLSLQKNKTRILGAKELKDEVALLVQNHKMDEGEGTDEQRLLKISLHFDPYSTTSIADYKALQEQIARVNISGILARELEKTRIDSVLVKKAIDALRGVEPNERRTILAELMKPDNLHTLAPIFTRLLIVLRDIYTELDTDTQDIIDNALNELVISGSYLISLNLNLAYVVQVLRHRSTEEKERLFVKLFKEAEPLVRREIMLAMTQWGHSHWLSDQKKNFNGFSKWERRSFIVASYFLEDEGSHWRGHLKSSFDPCENMIREWFAGRFQADKSVP